MRMEENVMSAQQEREFGEFQRLRRETEITLTLKKIVVDASGREIDRRDLKRVCGCAKKIGASEVLVSPVTVAAAKRELGTGKVKLGCIVGGTGETLLSVKKTEAKRAAKSGAEVIRLVPCYSRLFAGNKDYVKREVKKLRKAVKKCAVILSLEDRSLTEEQIVIGVKAAIEGKADGICVRGESPLVLKAIEASGERVRAEVSHVENSEQLRLLLKAGAQRFVSAYPQQIAEELYSGLQIG